MLKYVDVVAILRETLNVENAIEDLAQIPSMDLMDKSLIFNREINWISWMLKENLRIWMLDCRILVMIHENGENGRVYIELRIN